MPSRVVGQGDVPVGVGVQIIPGAGPGQVLVIPLAADHAAVVAAELEGGQVEGTALGLAGGF